MSENFEFPLPTIEVGNGTKSTGGTIEFPLPTTETGNGTKLTGGTRVYTLEKVLGQGGFGITYKASATVDVSVGHISQRVSMPFAIKEHFLKGTCYRGADGKKVEFAPVSANSVKDSLGSFKKEGLRLNNVCQLNRNIVNVNEVFDANNTSYYVMEYLDGGDLRQMIRDNGGGISEERALSIIRPIARAVACLHQNNMLHLDIKPDNIVLRMNADGVTYDPVLIDFGIAVHFDKSGHITTTHNMAGASEGYSPQEQYAKISTFATWMDVYSLAATCVYLLTGKDPLEAFQITDGYVYSVLPKTVSRRTADALAHAMKPSWQLRTKTVDDFLRELKGEVGLPGNYVLKGGLSNYRIVHIKRQEKDCCVYQAVIDTGEVATPGERNVTLRRFYTIREFYVEGGSVTRTPDYRVAGLEPYGAHSREFENFMKEVRKTTRLTETNPVNRSGDTVNCELFKANGTCYLVKREHWKPGPAPIPVPVRRWIIGILAAAVLAVAVVFAIKIIPGLIPKHDPLKDIYLLTAQIEAILKNLPEDDANSVVDNLVKANGLEDKVKTLYDKKGLAYTENTRLIAATDSVFAVWVNAGDENPIATVKINCYKTALRLKEDASVSEKLEQAKKETVVVINDPEPDPDPVPNSDTDDDKYNKAVQTNDYKALVQLAKNGHMMSSHALEDEFSLAVQRNDYTTLLKLSDAGFTDAAMFLSSICSEAVKSNDIDTIVHLQRAGYSNASKGLDTIYSNARTASDTTTLEKLASAGYANSYTTLARIYAYSYEFSKADEYLTKAYAVRSSLSEDSIKDAIEAVNYLDGMDHYNSESNKKLKLDFSK